MKCMLVIALCLRLMILGIKSGQPKVFSTCEVECGFIEVGVVLNKEMILGHKVIVRRLKGCRLCSCRLSG